MENTNDYDELAANIEKRIKFLFEAKKYEIAIKEAEKLLECDPNNYKALYYITLCYFNMEKYEIAAKIVQSLIEDYPESSHINELSGRIFFNNNEYEKSIKYSKAAVELDPSNAEAYYVLSFCFKKIGGKENFYKAKDLIVKALEIAPNNVEFHLHACGVYIDIGEYYEAKVEAEKALQLYPESARAHINYGVALIYLGDLDRSLDHFYESLKFNPNAAKAYEKAIDIEPDLAEEEFYIEIKSFAPKQKIRLLKVEDDDYSDDYVEHSTGKITFKDVGGMEKAKESININIILPLKNPMFFKAYGKTAGGGILLYGPPGCGKTFMAQATAGECNASFTSISITDILDMYVGESERNLHDIFENARRKRPAIVFIDEIDAIGGKRQLSNSSSSRSLTNQLLVEMDSTQSDNKNLLIIGATNTPWQVDSALRRPGRFDRILFIQPPDFKARIEILKLHLKDKPCDDIKFEAIAKNLVKYSGADIKAICDVASENVIKVAMSKGKIVPITTKDINNAIKQVKPSTIEWLNTAKNYATYSNQSGIYDEILDYLKTAD